MFERIISITNNYAIVKISNNVNSDILNYNVIFESSDNKKILGEIEEILHDEAKIYFLGEFIDNKFFDGIIRKPTLNSSVRIINQYELGELVGDHDNKTMPLGNSPLYNNYLVKVNIEDMFGNHTAILGSNGTGKTYAVARIIQNFFSMKDKIPFNSNIFIFSNSDEYDNAFKDINKVNSNFNYKLYSMDNSDDSNKIKLPLWILDVDDYANLLDVNNYFQISIIEKMLNYVSIFAKNDDKSSKYKNHLIAKSIISILYSNHINMKIRDLIFNILTICNTKELSLNVEVPGIGYTKEFKKCLDIDKNGDFCERAILTKYVQSFVDNDTKWTNEYIPTYFTLGQLEEALDFVLIGDGIIFNEKSYDDGMALKVKLHSLNNKDTREIFDVPNFITAEKFLNSLILTNSNSRSQIINFVLDDLDDKLANNFVKILCRILFKINKRMNPRGAMPIQIIFEDAHRYINNDKNMNIVGYNIFERIAKEGKKYAVTMSLITHKPTEVANTVLSQCSNFILFKSNQANDLESVKNVVSNISNEILEKTKVLQTGTCLVLGKVMKVPMIVKFNLPNPEPKSDNSYIYDKWIVDWNK